jgi:hypothetical protein
VLGGLRSLALREFRQAADWPLKQNNSVVDHMEDNRWSESASLLEEKCIGDT